MVLYSKKPLNLSFKTLINEIIQEEFVMLTLPYKDFIISSFRKAHSNLDVCCEEVIKMSILKLYSWKF